MNTKFHSVLLLLTLMLGTSLSGCSRVSEKGRDNRRLFDAILTAVVIRNPKELSKDKELLEDRHASGKLSKAAFDSINAQITAAQEGNWKSAEDGLYEFRKQNPFPN